MPLINLRTDLKSLRYGQDTPGGGYSGQPYIQAKIPDGWTSRSPDFLLRNGYLAPSDSLTDIKRLAKMFGDLKSPNGILFTAKQEILSNSNVRTQAGGILNQGVYTPLSTLAQAGLVAFGGHLNKQGIDPTGLSPLSLRTYSDVVNPELGAAFSIKPINNNRLVRLADKKIKGNYVGNVGVSLVDNSISLLSDDILTYRGGPGSILGVGNTNIRFADQRTGLNNPLVNTDPDYFYGRNTKQFTPGAYLKLIGGAVEDKGVSGKYVRLTNTRLVNALTASYALNAPNVESASFATVANSSTSASYALTASFALNSVAGATGSEGGGLFTVTSDGFNYNIAGYSGTFPTITVARGQLYYFNVSGVSASHPFALRLSSGNTATVPGTTNNDPVNGLANTNTLISYRVPNDAPNSIVYQCVIHSGMIGTINIVNQYGTTLTTGSTYPITSSWATNAISSSFATSANTAVSANSATSANTATSASFATVAGTATSATTTTSASYALTASFALNASGGGSGTVSGSANYISKFTSGTAVGNSVIYETGSNIGNYMFGNGSTQFFGFSNTTQPSLTPLTFDTEMNLYVNYSGWTNGELPPIYTSLVPQVSGGVDSFGNPKVAYNFETLEIPQNTISGNAWYTWVIAVSLTNNQIQTDIDLSLGNPNVFTNVLTETTIRTNTFTYVGLTIPPVTYRVYTTYPSGDFLIDNQTTDIYFKGGDVT